MTRREPTLGERRVGVDFNPGRNPRIDSIKVKAAALIDLIHEIPGDGIRETARCKATAMTAIEDGAMWAVKAAARSVAAADARATDA